MLLRVREVRPLLLLLLDKCLNSCVVGMYVDVVRQA